MDIYAEPGTIVEFAEEDVSKAQIDLGGHSDPQGMLTVGDKYTIDHTEVHSCHTRVFLTEYPGKSFNSVWFK